jgi:hypothetical protein
VTRLYQNAGYGTRMNLSCVVVAIAALFGVWELWSAWRAGGSDVTNYLFAAFFIGGAIYAAKQLLDGAANTVVALDADMSTRQAVITLWKPFSSKTISGSLDEFTDWQFQTRPGRGRTPLLSTHHPRHPRPLEFELTPGSRVSQELQALAPEAVEAFERATVSDPMKRR